MKTLFIDAWGYCSVPYDRILNVIQEYQPTNLLFWYAQECYPMDLIIPRDLKRKIFSKVNTLNLKTDYIWGSEEGTDFNKDTSGDYVTNNSTSHYFPMYWLYRTYFSSINGLKKDGCQFYYPTFSFNDLLDNKVPLEFDKLFVSLNLGPKYHRGRTIDFLSKYNLLDHGYVSWQRLAEHFSFDYWKQERLILDHNTSGMTTHVPYPDQYFKAPINLIGESTTDVTFITEKTCMAILARKIFLIVGSKGINSYLKKYGFELFDEIFDYSFDNESNLEKRIELTVLELKKLQSVDYYELYAKSKETIEHNFNNYLKIIKNRKYVPPIVEELINKPESFNIINNWDDNKIPSTVAHYLVN